ncbi:MAG TPA: FtsK/SpoIIIE domain-containing protein [Anaerolineales bacterium]|nr:FtsK/SpoIIIE domain-containing protein [Anaerolineales bacterium]
MTTNRQFSSALQALTELKTETSASPSKENIGAAPALTAVLAELRSLPLEALFLGVASDGLPVLLNLYEPHPGPMLIAGDAGSGKTTFLQTIAHSVVQTHSPDDLQFGVITNYPDEWQNLGETPHGVGVFPVGNPGVQEFMHSLVAWAHSNRNTHSCMLLLVDDLESFASLDLEAVQNFRWLLLRGPARRVWPIVTLNAPRYGQVIAWLQNFRTRVFGRIANARVAEALSGGKTSALDQLEAGIQFSLREKDKRSSPVDRRSTTVPVLFGSPVKENWLRFWLPSC